MSTVPSAVGSFCSHWYVGEGLPSALQLNVACEYRGAVITRSGPTSIMCGGSAKIIRHIM